MPAGIIRTPNSGRGAGASTKDANSAKKSGSAEGKGLATSNSGKKLVQTRLPFKLITPGTGTAGEGGASSTSATSLAVIDVDTVEPRKRKLSYSELKDDEATTIDSTSGSEDCLLRRSNSKENLAVGASTTKKVKTIDMEMEAEAMAEDVVALDDEDDSDLESNISISKQKVVAPTPIQIKLPLKNKRSKRRKSLKKSEEGCKADVSKSAVTKVVTLVASDSSDDTEDLAKELNPQKKQKVAETDKSQQAKTGQRKETTETDQKNSKELKIDSPIEESKTKDQAKKDVKVISTTEENESLKTKDKVEDDDKVKPEMYVQQISSSDSESNNQPDQQSTTDHDMDVDDTDTINKTSPEKQKPTRKSIPRATSSSAAAAASADGSESKKLDNLAPKQQRLIEQRRKAREEKEQKLQEERRLKQQEKEQREQQKKLERDQKEEQRRKERDQKEEQRRLEREERERKRQAEMDTKNEEKRKRNEAKEEIQRKKDEDRRRKEQEKEEAEQKKKRAAESFTKFFVQKQIPNGGDGSNNFPEHEPNSCDSGGQQFNGSNSQQSLAFRPFQVKDDMVMAPVTRNLLNSHQRKQLDTLFRRDDNEDAEEEGDSIGRSKRPSKAQLYLSELNLGKRKPLKTQRDARLQRRAKDEEEYDEVQIIDDMDEGAGMMSIVEDQSKQLPRMRAKYLHFADNRRPPYYGTWRKTTKAITARRPMAQDKVHFDYDLDSDCEWEEEEPGESLSASEDEKERDESEEESEEEYNEWYVPHGHLSDEELQNDGEMEDGNMREAQKAKLQVLQQEFAQEMKKQTKKIKPRLLGPVWLDENGKMSELYPACFAQTIDMYGCWQLEPLTLEPPPEPTREEEPINPTVTMQLDKPRIQQLIKLIHGNRNSKVFLISEFLEYLKGTQVDNTSQHQLPSKSLLREKFDELATWQPIELGNSSETPISNGSNPAPSVKKLKKPKKRLCWVVPEETLEKYDLKDLTLHNEWSYALTPKVKQLDTSLRDISLPDESTPPPNVPEEAAEVSPNATTTGKSGSQKKRAALLMSVPRDQPIHGPTKNALISRYLRRQSDAKANKVDQTDQPKSDVVILSD